LMSMCLDIIYNKTFQFYTNNLYIIFEWNWNNDWCNKHVT